MKSFLKRVLKFFFVPIIIMLICIVGYFIFDPFKVLRSYDSYSGTQTNRDYVTIETFKKHYPEKKYNSFIFGSSRLLAYDLGTWVEQLGDSAVGYKMEGFSENIYGIYRKVKYLDDKNIPIKNALIILDVDGTLANDQPQAGYMYRKHPETTDESWLHFQLEQFETYFDANMILRYYLYKLGGVRGEFISKYYSENTSKIDSITNDLSLPHVEYAIKTNPNFFEGSAFYDRPEKVTVMTQQINSSILLKLEFIKTVFDKWHTNYKIVIGPIYSQQVYDSEDLKTLETIFGSSNIYDFSGKNIFTEDKHNYYENFHYRPIVGDSIMKYIYSHHN